MILYKCKLLKKIKNKLKYKGLKTKFKLKSILSDYVMNDQLSYEECKKRSELIGEEPQNLLNPHILHMTPELLYEYVQKGLVLAIQRKSETIGFIVLKEVKFDGMKLYERGSLIIDPKYRKKGLAKHLIYTINQKHEDKMIYSVTKVPSVVHMCKSLGLFVEKMEEIDHPILNAIKFINYKKDGVYLTLNKAFSEFLAKSKYEFEENIIKSQSLQWADSIKEENEGINGKLMVEKSSEELLANFNGNGGVAVNFNDKHIGYSSLFDWNMDGYKIYEAGSVFVNKNYRANGLCKRIIQVMFDKYGDKPLFMVSKNPKLITIGQVLGLKEYKYKDLIGSKLEEIAKKKNLKEGKSLFVNEQLEKMI